MKNQEAKNSKALDTINRQAAIDAVDELLQIATHEEKHKLSMLRRVLKDALPSAQPEPCGDVVSRNAIIQKLNTMDRYVSEELRLCDTDKKFPQNEVFIVDDVYEEIVEQLPSAQPDSNKYEYHYDHTDCIWYRPEARNRCPVTCAQYRDGWNDAMNYIFRDGKGYRPYKRDEEYGE